MASPAPFAHLVVAALAAFSARAAAAPADEADAVCTGSSCTAGSALLQGRSRVTAALVQQGQEEDGGQDAAGFCCFWAPDASDVCGTCTAVQDSGTWCGHSQQRCNQCAPGVAVWCLKGAVAPSPKPPATSAPSTTPAATPAPSPAPVATTPAPMPTPAPSPAPAATTPAPAPGGTGEWQGSSMKMTHYWDCSGQGCDAGTLQPWDMSKYVSPPGYAPQDPMDFGGPLYGEAMWLTGAASDTLSALMGSDDGCCGADPNDGGVGGCGKCALVQNPDSAHPDWTAVVMKKNRCPPWSNGCGAGEPHFDIAAPGFDNLQYSTANICGLRKGTGFQNQRQSAALGDWWSTCKNTAECAGLCDKLPAEFRKGCRLFASWGWSRGDPSSVRFRAVKCPPEFVKHVGSQFGPKGPASLLTPSTAIASQ